MLRTDPNRNLAHITPAQWCRSASTPSLERDRRKQMRRSRSSCLVRNRRRLGPPPSGPAAVKIGRAS
jgi:hypothetical protein